MDFFSSSCTANDSHHYKQQQYCLADAPSAEPDLEIAFDENKELVAIHRTHLKNFDILYSSKMCGVYEKIEDMTDFDEINKRKFVWTKIVGKHRKPVHWWAQAYLANIPEIYIGYKNENALIETPIVPLLVKDIPNTKNFQPHVCMQFLEKILTLIEEKMSSINCPYTVCRFRYDAKQRSFLYKMY